MTKLLPLPRHFRPEINHRPTRGYITNRVWVCAKCRRQDVTLLKTERGYFCPACKP